MYFNGLKFQMEFFFWKIAEGSGQATENHRGSSNNPYTRQVGRFEGNRNTKPKNFNYAYKMHIQCEYLKRTLNGYWILFFFIIDL